MGEALPFTNEMLTYGQSLNDAAYSYASRELLDRIEAPRPTRKLVEPFKPPEECNAFEYVAVTLANVCYSLRPILDYHKDQELALNEMRANLTAKIRSGELIAYGYLSPRNPADALRAIPPDVFEGNIYWECSAVEGNGLRYFCVRVMPKIVVMQAPGNIGKSQNILPPPAEVNIGPPRIGRPSQREKIKSAYGKLKQSGEVDFFAPMIIAIRQVRRAAMAMIPDDIRDERGLGDEAIRKVIAEDFRKEREALKGTPKL